MNRRSQAEFRCLWCGYTANADENAASNLAERFSDEELNSLPFRDVETALALRFMRRLPDARSASAGLDTSPEYFRRRELQKVNQPGSNTRVIVVYKTGNYFKNVLLEQETK